MSIAISIFWVFFFSLLLNDSEEYVCDKKLWCFFIYFVMKYMQRCEKFVFHVLVYFGLPPLARISLFIILRFSFDTFSEIILNLYSRDCNIYALLFFSMRE